MNSSGPQILSDANGKNLIKAWVNGVPFDPKAEAQVRNAAKLPFIFRWIALMPDVHVGIGATVGSVIPTKGAIIPAAVGVDIGCGMMAVETSLKAEDLPDDLKHLRNLIESAVPHGFASNSKAGHENGSWKNPSASVENAWSGLHEGYKALKAKHPKAMNEKDPMKQLGTLGGGNHFVEVCLDERGVVWIMLHSGSRGIGNRTGQYFIELARQDMAKWHLNLPDKDLAYFPEGTDHFDEYFQAVDWAQAYARCNRDLMMDHIVAILRDKGRLPPFQLGETVVNCHHNYVSREMHFGEEILVTRKGGVRAGEGELGIIPGSMGARSYIVRGKGNKDAFCSCSHGAGRAMSRTEAKKNFTLADQARATEGVECRKDEGVLDEIPMAYKDIDAVMAAQSDLVDIVHTLKQVICVKG
jgi:tRNA-splicing ligase RtcB (3'-phosphate/5'-hydroxy nucleic acid ligase)